MTVEDPFAAWEFKGKRYAIASSLELGNFLKYGRCDKVYSVEALTKEAGNPKKMASLIALALKKCGARAIEVGHDFPAGLFSELRRITKISLSKDALFPERAIKTALEQSEIMKANKAVAAGIALCAEYIRKAKTMKGRLAYQGRPLTSGLLRSRVQELFLREGLAPAGNLIIAGGRQACDPHCAGYGLLKAGELIIVDLFAPLLSSHYWGDMTRTFIKGQPTDAQRKLVEAVAFAQREAIFAIRPGINGKTIHTNINNYFIANGYDTRRTKQGYEGFFHGTGHALGLDCHDLNSYGYRINTRDQILKVNEVYTVEPGLYYPEIGGCRIEDNGVVTKNGFKLLSKAPYDWVL
jgi:Xaa-Pro aminopeptidase